MGSWLPALLLAVTALCWGVSPILEKWALAEVSPFVGVTVRSLAIAVMVLVAVVVLGRTGQLTHLPIRPLGLFALSGFLAGLLGMWTYLYALKLEGASKVVPIAASYPLVTALLSVSLVGEELSLRRLLGTVLVVAGICLVR